MDLRTIALALGGDVRGRQVLAPGPGHSARDRSLAVGISAQAPDGFLVYSHAGDDWRVCREHVRNKLQLPQWAPGDERHQQRTIGPGHINKWDFGVIDAEKWDRTRSSDDLARMARGRELFLAAGDPRHPAVLNYFAARRLTLTAGLAGTVLRYHPTCPWRNENTGQVDRIPCLLAVFRSVDDNEISAVHRIRLDQPERWPKTQRMMLGLVRRAAVKLGAPADGALAIGEGVETALAATQLGLGAAWALGSVGNIAKFPVIDGIDTLTILGEAGDASARAAKICAQRWRNAGRRVTVAWPPVGSDHNDTLMRRAS